MSIGAIVLVQVKDAQPEGLQATPLEDGTLVHLNVPFGDEGAIVSALSDNLGLELDQHHDERGVFILPDVAKVEARRYDDVVEELGPAGFWVSLGPSGDDDFEDEDVEDDDDDEETDDDEDDDEEGEEEEMEVGGLAGGPALTPAAFSAAARILEAVSPATLLEMQRALQEGDVRKLMELRGQVEQVLGDPSDTGSLAATLLGQLGGLGGLTGFDPDPKGGGGRSR